MKRYVSKVFPEPSTKSTLRSPLRPDPEANIGSAALQMRPIDMAKIGFLYSRGGQFQGPRILDRHIEKGR